MKDLSHYQSLAQEMVRSDVERDRMLSAMDDMWHNRWSLPSSIADLRWIHKVVSTDPHDALRAGARVLSAVEPRIKLHPLGPNEETRANADKIERALAWHFRSASRRRRASVLRDVVLSALLYDEVVAQVVYLPHQIEAVQAFRGDDRRLKAAQRYGPFAIIVRNPRHVHVRYSDWMPEAVLLKKVMLAEEAVDFWGSKARKLKASLNRKENAHLDHVTLYDYMDLDTRVVWAAPQEGGASISDANAAGGIPILQENHDLGFLPWVAKVGGTTLEDEGGRQRIPLLYSVYQAGQWDTQNIVETLMASEVIAYAAAPRLKIEGPTDQVEVDYGEPGRPAFVPPGHDLSALAPPLFDQSLAVIADRIGARIGKSTVPRVLQSGDFPAGTAFATLNLATQSGIKALTPYKELAEQALAEMFTQMLNWVHYRGEPLIAYGKGREDGGKHYVIKPTDFDINNVYIDVELTADVPSDRMARINASALAVRELGYSRARALEQIGESDPDVIMRQAREEELEQVELEIEKQMRLAEGQFEARQLVEALEGHAAEEQRAEAAKGLQDLMGGSRFRALLQHFLGRGGVPNGDSQNVTGVGGQEFNPAMGGTPPAVAAPGVASAEASPEDELES